jgi:hypothetical protein
MPCSSVAHNSIANFRSEPIFFSVMARKIFDRLWVWLKQTLVPAADEVHPPYPLTLDEWEFIQAREAERAQAA